MSGENGQESCIPVGTVGNRSQENQTGYSPEDLFSDNPAVRMRAGCFLTLSLESDTLPQEQKNVLKEAVGKKMEEVVSGGDKEAIKMVPNLVRYAPEAKRGFLIGAILDGDNDGKVKRKSILAVEYVPESERKALLEKGLASKDEEVAKASILMVNDVPKSERKSLFEKAFRISSATVQMEALYYLWYLPESEQGLMSEIALGSEFEEVRMAAKK